MGSAVSSLSPEDGLYVSKHLKEKYELLVREDKLLNEQELQEKLTKEYQTLMKDMENTRKTREQDPASSSCNSSTVVPTATKRRGSKDVAASDEKPSIKRKGSRDDDNSKSIIKTSARNVNSPATNKTAVASGVDLTKKASSRIAASGGSTKQTGNANNNGRRRSFDTNQANNKKPAPAPIEPSAPPSNLSCASHDSNTSSSPSKRGGRNQASPTKTSISLHGSPPAVAGGLGNNASDAALLTAGNEVVDSWDSVTQQPYCKICCMAFKSDNFLERHVKFSDLHATNVKKLKGELNPAPIPVEPVKLAPLVKQIEGEHYKLLYTGSKFFWRTQDTIDIHIYLHILPNCLEVISYDTIKSKETNRIYLDYGRLMEIIQSHPSVAWRNNMTNEEKEKEREREGKGGEDKDKTDNNDLVTTFILQRLQLSSVILSETSNSVVAANIAAVTGNILVFTKLTGDDFLPEITTNHPQRSPILDKAPSVLIPINIVRRRRTNAEEIDATINELNNDRLALISATGKAEKIASLVYASASALASKKWYSDLNPLRKRWIWAIRLIIRQKHVAEVTKVLEAYEAKLETQKKQAAVTLKSGTVGGIPASRSKEI
jgi:hypothetical protein